MIRSHLARHLFKAGSYSKVTGSTASWLRSGPPGFESLSPICGWISGKAPFVGGVIGALMLWGNIAPGYCQAPLPPKQTLRYEGPFRSVTPDYSPQARAAGLQGSVILCVSLDAFGRLVGVQVIQGLGFGLEEKAIDAVRRWQFKSASLDGKPVRVKQSVEVRFAFNPDPSWRLLRAGYQVQSKPGEPIREIADPVLREYAKPDDGPCAAGAAAATVDVRMNKQGMPAGLQVIEEHGEGAGKAATGAIARWRFEPGRVNGSPRESKGTFLLECRAAAAVGEDADDAGAGQNVGNGVSAPALLYKVEPQYSEAARKAKFQGRVAVYLQVNPSGRPAKMCIVRMLGMGLDERAMRAINQWRFRPGMKNGAPVPVSATVEVSFRLL